MISVLEAQGSWRGQADDDLACAFVYFMSYSTYLSLHAVLPQLIADIHFDQFASCI